MGAITIKDNEAFLRMRSNEVSLTDRDLYDNIECVKKHLKAVSNCLALSAVQVGVLKRIVVIKTDNANGIPREEKDWLILLNPEIISMNGRTEFWEACESCLLNFGLVERPYKMTIRYQTINGETEAQHFEGFICTVLAHEMDHLEGILHMDRAKELYQMDLAERREFRKSHPYKIYSKNCLFKYEEISKTY